MQKSGDDAILVELILAREGEHVDAVEPMVRRVAHQRLDRRDDVGVRRLAQRREQGLALAHQCSLARNRTPEESARRLGAAVCFLA